MAFTPSIGDIMLLSSLAWKIGRAFTSGRGGAPAEFAEVKNELEGLASAIVSLCNALEEDNSILARADNRTKEGLCTILDSCRQTLENLDSFVNQYQEVIKPEGERGSVQRKWTSSFLRNYKKMWWTLEGGNIQDLRNMLQMHVQSISVTMQALQSKSLSRLESTVEPMAKQVKGIHDTVIGNIDLKIAEMHNLMMTMATSGSSSGLGSTRQGTPISMAKIRIPEDTLTPRLLHAGTAHGRPIGIPAAVSLRLKLVDGVEIIPYTIWGKEKKVVIRTPAELKYHALSTRDKPLNIAKTEWVNYVFETEKGADDFQSTLMGKRLLHSFKTRRTLRIHDSIVSTAFAFKEQLCGLENMRLWSDLGEGDGSVLAMIHYSANFKSGYLAFRLSGPYTKTQVKDDGGKWVEVKGLEVSPATSGTDMRAVRKRTASSDASKTPKQKNQKKINGVKIEFDDVADKMRFLELYEAKVPKGGFTGSLGISASIIGG
ncbi:MAG: hypothetical protein Q9163_004056 [Psora crenata]